MCSTFGFCPDERIGRPSGTTRRPHWPTFGYHVTTAWFSSPDLRVPPRWLNTYAGGTRLSVHTTLGWTIVKTRYAPVQYVLMPRTLTTCLMAWRRRPSTNYSGPIHGG